MIDTEKCEEYSLPSYGYTSSESFDELDEVQQIKDLSQSETRNIKFWRIVVAVFITIAGVLVTVGSYFYVKELEKKDARDAVSHYLLARKRSSVLAS